jgi:farnesyl-diphosphate farnesyltransferase
MASTPNDLLKATARSFYLTLRVLPGRVRPQIGLAYLLARTTDTVADTDIVPAAQRLEALRRLRERILGTAVAPLQFGELAREQGSPGEKLLLEKVEESLAVLQAMPADDRQLIQAVLTTITSGQALDLQRFAGTTDDEAGHARGDTPRPGAVIALKTSAELDDYTYRVAGCVGEFWTKLCRAHLFPRAALEADRLIADGIRFGKGLQLVNILRDLPADLKNGRCYLPLEKLTPAGLTPERLLAAENETSFRRVLHAHLAEAEAHLEAGWRYTTALTFSQLRVRLASAWPVLVGIKTVRRLRAASVADLQQRVKVPRREVQAMMLWSALACPVPFLWRRLYRPDHGVEKR